MLSQAQGEALDTEQWARETLPLPSRIQCSDEGLTVSGHLDPDGRLMTSACIESRLAYQFLTRREKYLVNGINNAIMEAESWLTCGMGHVILAEGLGCGQPALNL